jgi:hypothetical protein
MAHRCTLRQLEWRTECEKKVFGAPCLVSFAYWRRGKSVRQYIGGPMSPAALLLADQWFHISWGWSEQNK